MLYTKSSNSQKRPLFLLASSELSRVSKKDIFDPADLIGNGAPTATDLTNGEEVR
jgi:hypothetical protein